MKKTILIFLLFLMVSQIKAQGDVSSPYSTAGWDPPVATTQYYNLFIFTLLTNPGGWRNLNTVKIDSLFNALVVFTDKKQLWISNDTLHFSDSLSYQGVFATTDTVDSVAVPGADSNDIAIVSAREANPQAYLWVQLKNNLAIVNRSAGTVSGLKYNFIWIRRY